MYLRRISLLESACSILRTNVRIWGNMLCNYFGFLRFLTLELIN